MKIRVNEETLFCLCLIDIMFLPYLRPVSFPFSYFLIIIWYLYRGFYRVQKYKDYPYIVLFSLLAAVATVLSPLLAQDTSFSTDIKRFLQYVMCFLCLLFFEYMFKNYMISISKFFVFFMVIMGVYAIFYLINPYLYATIKSAIYPADNHTSRFLMNQVAYRFNYIIADPNNVGYISDGIFAYLIFHEKLNTMLWVSVSALQVFILFTTQSIGASVVFAAIIVIYILFFIINGIRTNKLVIRSSFFHTAIALGLLVVLLVPKILNSSTFQAFTNRTMVYRRLGDSSGGRMTDFLNGVAHFSIENLFVGMGEERVVSEIGHWYLIYMYGGIAYFIFLFLVFRKNPKTTWREYFSLFPFFMGFTMNIAIGEQKFLLLMLLVVAKLRSESDRRGSNNIYQY